MSYGFCGSSGRILRTFSILRVVLSPVSTTGLSSMLLLGRNDRSRRTSSKAASSFSIAKWATPDLLACDWAPPSSSKVVVSPVTLAITSGPVRNICDVFSTMKIKSVRAGEYTAPPAQGPRIILSCGMTPDAWTFLLKIVP